VDGVMAGLTVQVKRVSHRALLPRRMSEGAAGWDLFACLEQPVLIEPGERALIPTGLLFAVPEGMEAQIRPRSGLALKHGVTVLNSPGTIDSDYRGEVKVILVNLGNQGFEVTHGMRIAQAIFSRIAGVQVVESAHLSDTVRGSGGFGHTGS